MDKGVRGLENWTIFMDVICVSYLKFCFLSFTALFFVSSSILLSCILSDIPKKVSGFESCICQ